MPKTDPKNLSKQENKTFDTVYYDNKLEDNIIDLFQILVTVWKWKRLIIVITVFSIIGSYIYVKQMPLIFKAETLLLPPTGKKFQSLNLVGIKELARHDPESKLNTRFNSGRIFRLFKENLKSRSIHRKFVKEYRLMDYLAPNRTPETREVDIYGGFTGLINLEENEGVTSLSLELNDPEIAAQWVNNFTKFVDQETVNMLVGDVQNAIENRKREIEYDIRSKRLIAEKRREDQIIRYTEHAEIAKKLGMIGRVDATNIIQNTQMNADKSGGIRRQSTATSPLYYLGFEALMTEINILRDRKSDDPFISGLRDLQEQLEMLNSIKLKHENVSSVRIDMAAYPPKSPIKPNIRFVVTFVTVITFFSAIILSLLIEFILSKRKKI